MARATDTESVPTDILHHLTAAAGDAAHTEGLPYEFQGTVGLRSLDLQFQYALTVASWLLPTPTAL